MVEAPRRCQRVKALSWLRLPETALLPAGGVPPGVGKTHLSVALALKAIDAGHGVYFVRAHELLEDLRRAQDEHHLDRRMRVYLAPKVLIIDEFGVWPYDRAAATALFALISARYERGSVMLTSNKGFAEWGDVLGDTVIATAILDRLLHHSHVINIRGESYRLREKKRAGLLGSLAQILRNSKFDSQFHKAIACVRYGRTPASRDPKHPVFTLLLRSPPPASAHPPVRAGCHT
jgi:predicted ATPase